MQRLAKLAAQRYPSRRPHKRSSMILGARKLSCNDFKDGNIDGISIETKLYYKNGKLYATRYQFLPDCLYCKIPFMNHRGMGRN